jgi:hypothetical protein
MACVSNRIRRGGAAASHSTARFAEARLGERPAPESNQEFVIRQAAEGHLARSRHRVGIILSRCRARGSRLADGRDCESQGSAVARSGWKFAMESRDSSADFHRSMWSGSGCLWQGSSGAITVFFKCHPRTCLEWVDTVTAEVRLGRFAALPKGLDWCISSSVAIGRRISSGQTAQATVQQRRTESGL